MQKAYGINEVPTKNFSRKLKANNWMSDGLVVSKCHRVESVLNSWLTFASCVCSGGPITSNVTWTRTPPRPSWGNIWPRSPSFSPGEDSFFFFFFPHFGFSGHHAPPLPLKVALIIIIIIGILFFWRMIGLFAGQNVLIYARYNCSKDK